MLHTACAPFTDEEWADLLDLVPGVDNEFGMNMQMCIRRLSPNGKPIIHCAGH